MDPDAAPVPLPARPLEAVQRWRLTVRRGPDAPILAQRDQQAMWESAVLASGLPVAMGEGAAPRPRVTSAAPLAQGMVSDGELLELHLTRRCPIWRVREGLLGVLPQGHALIALQDVWLGEPALPGRVIGADYEAVVEAADGPELTSALARAIAALLAAPTLPRQRAKGDRTVSYDLRPFVESVAVVDGRAADGAERTVDAVRLRMRLRHDAEKGIGRPDELLAELGERVGRSFAGASVRRTGIVLAEPKGVERSMPSGPGPRGPRGPRRPR